MEQALRLLLPLPRVWAQTFADWWLPKLLAAAVAGASEFLFPLEAGRTMAIGAMALICLDTVTGWHAAWVTKEPITSARFSRVLTKVLGYGSVVIVAAVAMRTLPGTDQYHHIAVTGVLGFVILTEGISILENVTKMGLNVPPWLRKWVRERLKDKPSPKD